MIKSQHVRLFLISFLILFLELAVIRYIPSQVRYVGFFSNIILLGAFVGIGWGTLFKDYVKIPDFFLPIFIFIFELLIGVFQYDLIITSNEVVYFSALNFRLQGEPVFLLPVIFFIVVILGFCRELGPFFPCAGIYFSGWWRRIYLGTRPTANFGACSRYNHTFGLFWQCFARTT